MLGKGNLKINVIFNFELKKIKYIKLWDAN